MISPRSLDPILQDVVILSDTGFIDGGGAAVAIRSAIALAQTGLRVTVISAVGPPMQELLDEPSLRFLCSDQGHIGTSTSKALTQSLWNKRAADLLRAVLAKCSPANTVVHVHGWTKALSSSVFYAARRLGFKVVVTLHDFFSICPNGSLYNHPQQKICTLRPMGIRCVTTNCDSRNFGVKSYRVFRQLVQKRLAGMPGEIDTFISVSEFSRSIIEPHLPPNSKVYAVQNPTDCELTAPSDPESSSEFLYLGRLSPEKGASLFAEAAVRAKVQAVFAGDGPCAANVKRTNSQANLIGWLGGPQVAQQIRRSRALVLPSLWYETYGLTVTEAAAAGVPAVVADSSAARDSIIDNKTGLLFEGGNAASLASKLIELSRPGVAKILGSAAYNKFWSNAPTMNIHVRNLIAVYDSILREQFRTTTDRTTPTGRAS